MATQAAKSIGARIDARLRELGQTREWLAEQIGVERVATVYDWLAGRQMPKLDHALRIAMALQLSIYELAADLDQLPDPDHEGWRAFLETSTGRSLTPQERRALRLILWPDGVEPAPEHYAMMLATMRSAPKRAA